MSISALRDAGLQPERTVLAWRRTMLTALCVLGICVRAWTEQPSPMRLAAVVCLGVVVGVLVGGLAQRRRRYRANPEDPGPTGTVLLAAVGALAAAAALMYLISLR
ncbi:DUF202 domain-containing protein [Rhodococcus aetherivorans]|uniref:DUF202 domain-containing protein n=1 Tax=Rhodococcus aetherivorans TaxID=191292 RepID=UPI0036AB292E